MRRALLLVVLLADPRMATGQEPAYLQDLQMASELRKRGMADLALEWLTRLETANKQARPPSKELAGELPLEFARTRVDLAATEADPAKRLAAYKQAALEFEKFLRDNPNHARAGEATLDAAQVAGLLARNQLAKALGEENDAEGTKARTMLEAAGQKVKAARSVLEAQARKLADDRTLTGRTALRRVEDALLRAELALGINLFDQSRSYIDDRKEAIQKARADKLVEALDVFKKLGEKDDQSPVCWQARAWEGLMQHENGESKKARDAFAKILLAGRIADDGKRLARYFKLRVIKDKPEAGENVRRIIESECKAWLADPTNRPHLRSFEGYGIRYLLARNYLDQLPAEATPANKKQRDDLLAEARRALGDLDETENEYTDKARRMKVSIMKEQGGFDRKVADLRSFEDCYVRAQYEIFLLGEEMRKTEDPDKREAKRKQRTMVVIDALDRGLKQPDAKPPKATQQELNNARALLAFYNLGAGKYREAVKVGGDFARNDPRSPQAALAATYALQAFAQLIEDRVKAGDSADDIKADREGMLDLARYIEGRWKNELAGDLARHQIGLNYLREQNYPEAIKTLAAISSAYGSYPLSQLQLAGCYLELEQQEQNGENRKKAVAALRAVPDPPADAEPTANYVHALVRAKLGGELYTLKQYKELDALATRLVARLQSARLDGNNARNDELREQLGKSALQLKLYADYGQASQAFDEAKYADVVRVTDPLVDKGGAGKLPEIKENAQLGSALFGMALQANVYLGKFDRARAVVKALKTLSADETGGAPTILLKQLNALIRDQLKDIRRKNDQGALKKAVEGFTLILDDVTKEATKDAKLPPDLLLLVAQNYSAMGVHDKALELVKLIPEPKAIDGAEPDPTAVKQYQGARLLLARELRLGKKLDEARALLDKFIGTAKAKGWGYSNVDVQIERVRLLEDEGKYGAASTNASGLVKALAPRAAKDNDFRERYFECAYLEISNILKYGQAQSGKEVRAKYVRDAAVLLTKLEKSWKEQFGPEWDVKFDELLKAEPELKEAYDKLTK